MTTELDALRAERDQLREKLVAQKENRRGDRREAAELRARVDEPRDDRDRLRAKWDGVQFQPATTPPPAEGRYLVWHVDIGYAIGRYRDGEWIINGPTRLVTHWAELVARPDGVAQ